MAPIPASQCALHSATLAAQWRAGPSSSPPPVARGLGPQVVRTCAELELFAETLLAAVRYGHGTGLSALEVEVSLFVTRLKNPSEHAEDDATRAAASAPGSDPMRWARSQAQAGRPCLKTVLRGVGSDATIFACGPAPLTAAASEVAFERGAAFHAETFHF